MCLNRALHKCYARVREGNFTLNGLTGFDVHGKTVGIVGAPPPRRGCRAQAALEQRCTLDTRHSRLARHS